MRALLGAVLVDRIDALVELVGTDVGLDDLLVGGQQLHLALVVVRTVAAAERTAFRRRRLAARLVHLVCVHARLPVVHLAVAVRAGGRCLLLRSGGALGEREREREREEGGG